MAGGEGARVVAVDALRVAGRGEVLLVDAVAQAFRDAADDGAPDLAGRHLAQLGARRVRVEGRMRGAQEVGRLFQVAYKKDHTLISLF